VPPLWISEGAASLTWVNALGRIMAVAETQPMAGRYQTDSGNIRKSENA